MYYLVLRGVFLIIGILSRSNAVKIKIIGEPFSFRGRDTSASHFQGDIKLNSKVPPQPASGPQHLFSLNGQCFSLQKATYKYEFCPFQNVTQREQSYRWNAYSGVLGIYQEWIIENDTFCGMMMTRGDNCVDRRERSVKVFFQCGNSTQLESVSEPATCKYEMQFITPLVCPNDSMIVYPVLDNDSQNQFKLLKVLQSFGALRGTAYNTMMRELLERNRLLCNVNAIPVAIKEDDEEAKKDGGRFESKTQCTEEYEKLLIEVQQLRQALRSTNTSLNANETAIPITLNSSNETINSTVLSKKEKTPWKIMKMQKGDTGSLPN